MNKQCPVCKAEYPDAVTFCASDGTPLTSAGSPQDRFIDRVLDGKYRIEKLLGSGGMGNVYRAKHLLMETNVAVKILHAALVSDSIAVERFRREARAALTVNHSNAIQVMDFGVTNDNDQVVYIVMELLDGISLQHILDTDRTVPIEKTVQIFKQVCAAVSAAHDKKVIHRDLKPDNIVILNYNTPTEHVKVLDFSIAKVISSGDMNNNLTAIGLVVGTPQYMSPEQAQGMELEERADIYSLGITLYHMLTGILPFTADSSMVLALKHINALPRPLRDINPAIPPAIEAVVMKAIAKRPGDRQQTAKELLKDLEEAIKEPITEPLESPSKPTDKLEKKKPYNTGKIKSARTTGHQAAVTHNVPVVTNTTPIVSSPSPPSKTTTEKMEKIEKPAQQQTAQPVAPQEPAIKFSSLFESTPPPRRSNATNILIICGVAIVGFAATLIAFLFWKSPAVNTDIPLPITDQYFQNMVWIEGETFNMGRMPAKGVSLDETPVHQVTVGDFWIDAYEVTNQEYQKFVLAAKHNPPETWKGTEYPAGEADMPVTNVSWDDAVEYCKWLTKESKSGHTFRLPTEAQWEYAARSTDERLYPWGKTWSPNRTVSGESNTSKLVSVNSSVLANDLSPFRIFGMAGNVTEWTISDYTLYPNSKAEMVNCPGCKMLRGGNYLSPNTQTTTTFRAQNPSDFKSERVGFRVAADASPEDRKLMKKDKGI